MGSKAQYEGENLKWHSNNLRRKGYLHINNNVCWDTKKWHDSINPFGIYIDWWIKSFMTKLNTIWEIKINNPTNKNGSLRHSSLLRVITSVKVTFGTKDNFTHPEKGDSRVQGRLWIIQWCAPNPREDTITEDVNI